MNVPYFRKKRTDQGAAFPFPLGLSLLFVSFLALCIFSFAVLSLLTARNGYRISQKTAEHQSAYYAASNKAEDRIAELNAQWREAKGTGKQPPEKVSFQVAIYSGSVLSVALEGKDTTEEGGTAGYQITEWKEISTGEWKPETTIPVMTPGVS